jgi:hypothetical protein
MHLLAAKVADEAAKGSASANAIVPTLILLAIVALLIGIIAVVRRTIFKRDDTSHDPMAGFSLGSLRQLVKEGKMTPEEYEKAKAQLVQAAQRKIDEQATPVDVDRLAAEQKPRAE